MIPHLSLTKEHLAEMLAYVESQTPLEACGLLAGKKDRVEKVLPVRNKEQSRVRFIMDPYEQLHAFEWIDSNGLELLGIFHSHPTGPETVSATDVAEAAYEVVHVICSRTDGQWIARGFWIENGRFFEIPLLLKDQ
jgi:proteasome lid subunit RPN8/RPN11